MCHCQCLHTAKFLTGTFAEKKDPTPSGYGVFRLFTIISG